MQPPILSQQSLLQHINNGHSVRYLFFWSGVKRKDGAISKTCFSQWWRDPFTVAGDVYASAEHYMMAEKARLFGDSAIRAQILACTDPRKAKALGRKVKGFDAQVWDRHRFDIVVAGNLAKFRAYPAQRAFLLGTADQILVEASPQDRVWGIGLAEDDVDAADPSKWRGLNLLGFALHQVRYQLSQETEP